MESKMSAMEDAQYNALLDAFVKERNENEKLKQEIRELKEKLKDIDNIINPEE